MPPIGWYRSPAFICTNNTVLFLTFCRNTLSADNCIRIEGGNAEKCSVKVAKQILCAVKCMQKGK